MIQKDDLPEYLTLKEVSELLKVHENTLRNWDKDGILKANRIGVRKLYRYKKEDILNSVSYTHLDVYKRQVMMNMEILVK